MRKFNNKYPVQIFRIKIPLSPASQTAYIKEYFNVSKEQLINFGRCEMGLHRKNRDYKTLKFQIQMHVMASLTSTRNIIQGVRAQGIRTRIYFLDWKPKKEIGKSKHEIYLERHRKSQICQRRLKGTGEDTRQLNTQEPHI